MNACIRSINIIHFVILFSLCVHTSSGDTATVAERWCQYRNLPYKYNAEIFRRQISYACYNYTRDAWFNTGMRYPGTTLSVNGTVYQGILVNETRVTVDYKDPASVALISECFKSQDYTDKWMQCGDAAMQCCDWMLSSNQEQVDGCGPVWDGWQCWRGAKDNTTKHEVCPAFIYNSVAPTCNHYSAKGCWNGTWTTQTCTASCDERPRLRQRIQFHVIMLSVSLVFTLPAIAIFFYYRKLRESMRVVLNRNLLIAITLKNILTIISKTTIILDALSEQTCKETVFVMTANGVPCKILAVLEKLASNAVFVTMLLLGIFLHRLIAAAFKGEPNMLWYFVGGAIVDCVPVIAWTIVMAIHNDHNCWTVDNKGYHWINDIPRIVMLLVNLVLIADIIRVLVTKLGKVNTGNSTNIRRTIKATVFLAPVFGIQFLFTAIRPQTSECTNEQVYYFFSYGLDGIQGALVAFFFCYLNKEVETLLRRSLCPSRSSTLDHSRTTFTTIEPNLKNIADPPSPVLDARAVRKRPNPRSGSILKSPSTFSTGSLEDHFYTPRNSETGSPPSSRFYTPRSSVADIEVGSFYECVDVEQSGWRGGNDNGGFVGEVGRERSGSEYFDVKTS